MLLPDDIALRAALGWDVGPRTASLAPRHPIDGLAGMARRNARRSFAGGLGGLERWLLASLLKDDAKAAKP